jgi:hypothetical protein
VWATGRSSWSPYSAAAGRFTATHSHIAPALQPKIPLFTKLPVRGLLGNPYLAGRILIR